jgi:hypothetical protein
MAVLLAAEAWTQLQQPEGARVSVIALIGHNLPVIALPLVAVCLGLACSWLMRRRRQSAAPDPVFAEPPAGAAGTELRDPHTPPAPAPGLSAD